MINLQMAAVFLIDVIEIIVIFTMILGLTFRKSLKYFVAAMAVVICCVIIILNLHDPGNRIFFTLAAHVLLAVALFDGKGAVVGELAFLLHFVISIIDTLCEGILMLLFKGHILDAETKSSFNMISNCMGGYIPLNCCSDFL